MISAEEAAGISEPAAKMKRGEDAREGECSYGNGRRNDVARTEPDDVSRHQFPCGKGLPGGVAQDPGVDLQALPQGFDDSRGPALLHVAHDGIHDQQGAHHGEIGKFPERGGEHHDQFEHPRRNAPEFPEEIEHWMSALFGDLVVPVLLPASLHLRGGQAGVWIRLERARCDRDGCGPGRHAPNLRTNHDFTACAKAA